MKEKGKRIHSIRTKITLLNVLAMTVGIAVATMISAFTISNLGHESSERTLGLLCESGKSSLNSYFKSVEQSVNTVSKLVDNNLDEIPDAEFNGKLSSHMEQSKTVFNVAALNTAGVLTYYYRIDPSISDVTGEKGFWFTDLNRDGKFEERQVTDLSDDQYECLWFYKPKYTRQPLWLPPYFTDGLDEFVISYNVPVYRHNDFVGVVGIEISYRTIGDQIKDIKALKTGYAFIIENKNCTFVYHPEFDLAKIPISQWPTAPKELCNAVKSDVKGHAAYSYNGIEKHASWMLLTNDMTIVVAAPVSEVTEIWANLVIQVVGVALGVVALFAIITILYTRRITKPLKELTLAAERINNGDYSTRIEYRENDEIGVLTTTVNRLVEHLGGYINDLNSMAYADSLTSVSNRSAFEVAIKTIQERIDSGEEVHFAIGVFDCDDLKVINDRHGHDRGNIYLRNSSHLIQRTFQHSDVYRIGGDEFAVILQGEDYEHRHELKKQFVEKSIEICAFAKEPWERIRVSVGIANYDSDVDKTAEDVLIHADHLMYDNKRERKKNKKS